MMPHYKKVFSKADKALFKSIADQVRAKRLATPTTPAKPEPTGEISP